MKKIILSMMMTLSMLSAAPAAEWSLDKMNSTIEQTNFIVENQCSGTLIDKAKKLVLTNYHCVDNLLETIDREVINDEGFVKKMKLRRFRDAAVDQYGYDGFEKTKSVSFVAEVVADSKRMDLAVIRIKGDIPNTYASPLAERIPGRGERIYTVGNPAMLEASVFEGVVSNVNRTFEFPWTDGEKSPMIQFSGGIVGGNSGGALYNTSGELVGVPAAVARSNVLGLAIPITTVKSFFKMNCLMTEDDEKCKTDKADKAEKKKKKED